MPNRRPVIASLTREGLQLDCLVAYNRRALLPLKKEGDQTPACDLIERGIKDNWSGHFLLTGPLREALELFSRRTGSPGLDRGLTHLPVTLHIRRLEAGLTPALASLRLGLTGGRRPVRIYLRPSLFMPAHVASPLLRRFWGIFRTGQLESVGLNWSPRHPGTMTIPTDSSPRRLPQIAAHEAGHIFGLGDAYGAWYRFFYPAPGTEGFMMRDNTRVQPLELALLLRAQATGRMQYFERSFRPGLFARGLLRSLGRPFRRLRKKS